jgi:integrase
MKIPISSKLRKVLLEQKLKTGWSNYVFLTPENKPYSSNNPTALKRAFGAACRRALIKGLRFHDLRHTATTRMIEKGANIAAVRKVLGHANINTTMRYAHPEDSVKDAVEKLAKFNSFGEPGGEHGVPTPLG